MVISDDVRVAPTAITHGALSLTITPDGQMNFNGNNPFSNGKPGVTGAQEPRKGHAFMFGGEGVALSDLVKAINAVGAAPSDIVAILETLKQVGALRADLIIL